MCRDAAGHGTWPRLSETRVRVSERLAHVTGQVGAAGGRLGPLYTEVDWDVAKCRYLDDAS